MLPMLRIAIKRTDRAYVLIDYEGKVLVVQNWLGRQKWQFPGGGIKSGEDPKSAGVREVREELDISLDSSKLKLLKEGFWKTDNLGFHYYVFRTHCQNKPKPANHSLEIINASWFSPEQLIELNIPFEVLELITKL